jgi:hypothetical protein
LTAPVKAQQNATTKALPRTYFFIIITSSFENA